MYVICYLLGALSCAGLFGILRLFRKKRDVSHDYDEFLRF